MESIDAAMARRVWSRVQGQGDKSYPKREAEPAPSGKTSLAQMVLLTAQTGQLLALLFQSVKGKDRQVLQQMANRYEKRKQALQGLCKLQQGQTVPIPRTQRRSEGAEQLCRGCIGQLQQLQEGCRDFQSGQFGDLFTDYGNQIRQDLERMLRFLAQL